MRATSKHTRCCPVDDMPREADDETDDETDVETEVGENARLCEGASFPKTKDQTLGTRVRVLAGLPVAGSRSALATAEAAAALGAPAGRAALALALVSAAGAGAAAAAAAPGGPLAALPDAGRGRRDDAFFCCWPSPPLADESEGGVTAVGLASACHEPLMVGSRFLGTSGRAKAVALLLDEAELGSWERARGSARGRADSPASNLLPGGM